MRPEFLRAQYDVLTRQVPLMYIILLINMSMLTLVHVGTAPFYMTTTIPAIFAAICVFRTARMILARNRTPTDADVRKQIRMVVILSWILGTSITAWSMALFSYGDAFTKGQVIFFSGVSIVIVIASLAPLRQVALIMFSVSVVPTGIFLLLQPEIVFKSIAINLVLVIGAMIFVLRRSHRDFRQRVEKEIELQIQRRELQSLNEKISLLANEDSLTGLPNRRSFFDTLKRLIETNGAGTGSFAIGLIDLDGFKPVNDLLGHGAGDRLLCEVGQRLKSGLPDDTVLARLGGDEFAIILDEPGSDAQLRAFCQKMLAVLEPVFHLDEGAANISATCGVARFPDAGRTDAELFERADFALYYSKENDRGAVTIFSDFHETAIKKAATIGQRLREGDLEETMFMEYQPIIDGKTGGVRGMEALARWIDPVLGRVPPDVFIRAAEQNGIIGRVTLMLFDKALKDAADWPDHLYLSFNLSAHDLCSVDIMSALFDGLEKSGFPAGRLVFEITESAIMQDFDRAIVALEALRAAGCAIALDDFGTGYSSLSYVRRLPIDRLKIDRSFVHDIEKEPAARAILKTITDLCRNLDLQCIIEGVETHSQLATLTSIGCTAYQGYLFAKPMKASGLHLWLAERERTQRAG